MAVGGSRGYKNMLEKLGKNTKDGAGKSGADLERDALLNLAGTTGSKDGPTLIQMAADSATEVEATD